MAMFVVGGLIWIPDDLDAYKASEVKEIKGDKIVSTTPNGQGKSEFPMSQVCERKKTHKEPVSMMDDLHPLNMAEILDNVDALFHKPQHEKPGMGGTKIYAGVGPILIAMNPFEALPVYGKPWVDAYHSAGSDQRTMNNLGPHAFKTAEDAYQGMHRDLNQAVVICGESGAGKTVTNRKMLEYICQVAAPKEGTVVDPEAITNANVLLESFGNAKTTRNDNSSRFGKLTTVMFKEDKGAGVNGKSGFSIIGCGATHYLLERSRIMGAPEMERNYHIFYQLIRSGTGGKYKLSTKAEEYALTKVGADDVIPDVDDKRDFEDLVQRMGKAGFNEEKRGQIFEGIASVIHLGNVPVTGDENSSSIDSGALATAADLLGVDAKALAKALCVKMLKVPGSGEVAKDISKVQAEGQLGTVGKMVYSRIFDDIVYTIDDLLRGDARGKDSHEIPSIGLLDIFGFEDMAKNGFEQMFINLTNERIQHLFNTIMFDREKAVYEKEGINADFLKGPKNIECVNLFLAKKPAGIVHLIGDALRGGQEDKKVDGENLVSLLNRSCKANPFFQVCDFQAVKKVVEAKHLKKKGHDLPFEWKECFGIKHYAGYILYTVENFIPKSRDALASNLTEVMKASKKPFIAKLFEGDTDDAKNAGTVGTKFAAQLTSLSTELEMGDTLFVRCIKSNTKKVPDLIERGMVMEQLVRGGVVAALEMRAAGLPDSMTYEDFLDEYKVLKRGKDQGENPKAICEKILRDLLPEREDKDHIKFGHTKVFMKTGICAWLQGVMKFKYKMYARRIQAKLWFTRVMKIAKSWTKLEEAKARAENEEVWYLKTVQDTVNGAMANLKPSYDALNEAKAKHGKDYAAIFAALGDHMQTVNKMQSMTDSVDDCITKYSRRKQEVETALGRRVAAGQAEAYQLMDRVKAVEDDSADCRDMADPKEMEQCDAACKKVKEAINKLQRDILPKLKEEETSEGQKKAINLEKEPWVVDDPCPEIDRLIGEVTPLIEEAERLAFAVLRVRREMVKALEDLQPKLDEADATLNGLQEVSKECIEQGMNGVRDAIAAADRAGMKLDDFKAAPKLPQGTTDAAAHVRGLADDYIKKVEAAVAAVQAGQEELEKRRREAAERLRLANVIDDISAKMREFEDSTAKKMEKIITDQTTNVTEELQHEKMDIQQEVSRVRQSHDAPLEELTPKVDALEQKAKALLEKVQKIVDEAKESSKAAFNARRSVFEGK